MFGDIFRGYIVSGSGCRGARGPGHLRIIRKIPIPSGLDRVRPLYPLGVTQFDRYTQ